MKAFKFFAVVIAAFAMLVACEQQVEPENNPGGGNDTITTPNDTITNDTIPAEEAMVIELDWSAPSEVNGQVYEVGMANYDPNTYELIVDVVLKNTTEVDKTFTINEYRAYDLETAIAALCVSTCSPGDMSKEEQNWEIGTVAAGEELEIALHLTPLVTEPTIFSSKFTFSDGTDNVVFKVNYNYTPAK